MSSTMIKYIKLLNIVSQVRLSGFRVELSALWAGLKDERRTSNVQRRILNKEFYQFINWRSTSVPQHKLTDFIIRCSTFDVRCSTFKRIVTLPFNIFLHSPLFSFPCSCVGMHKFQSYRLTGR